MAIKKKRPARKRKASERGESRKRKALTRQSKKGKRSQPARKPARKRLPGAKQLPGVKPIESHRVVIKFRDKLVLPYTDDWADKREAGPWEELEARFGKLTLRPMFTTVTPEAINKVAGIASPTSPEYRSPNFTTYFFVYLQSSAHAEEAARALSKWRTVQYAYVDFPTSQAQASSLAICSNAADHFAAAPQGVSGARAALFAGGNGDSMHFIDIESGWTTDHASVAAHFPPTFALLAGLINDFKRDHGTAVLGIVCGQGGLPGYTGLAPRVSSVQLASVYRGGIPVGPEVLSAANAAKVPPNLYDAIFTATYALKFSTPDPSPGAGRNAVMLIEQELPLVRAINGKDFTIDLPVEILQGYFDLIKDAVAHGITVIEPAGNGRHEDGVGIDLANVGIARTSARDSGAIMVGAAQSSVVFTSSALKAGHDREPHCNFGAAVDCYAWGDSVVTSSSPQTNPPFSTTVCMKNFNGTSAASAIVAAVALAVQGICQKSSLTHPLHPSKLRSILRASANGTPIYDIPGPGPASASGPIGVMPDLNKILATDNAGFAAVLGATI